MPIIPSNDFLPFATNPSANVISQATWAAGTLSQGQSRIDGFLGGTIAESEEANKIWRQSSFVTAAVAQFISDTLGVDVLDNGDLAGFESLLIQAIYRTAGQLRITQSAFPNGYQLYVSNAGNDNNNGLSIGTAFATLQRAWNQLVFNVDLDGNVATVNIAPGTYGPLFAFGPIIGSQGPQSVNFIGDVVTPTNVVVSAFDNSAFSVGNSQLTIKGVAVSASGVPPTTGVGIIGIYGSTIVFFDRVDFGGCATAHWGAVEGAFVGTVLGGASYAISGSAANHVYSIFGGNTQFDNVTISVAGNPTFGSAFANAGAGGIVRSAGCVFGGPAQGPHFFVNLGGQIITQGSGAAYFPGNIPGTADNSTGGYYS